MTYEMSVALQNMRNAKGVVFDLSDRVQYARAYLYACKALGVDVMRLYGVTAYLAEGKTLAEGYAWFGEFVDTLMAEGAYILHVDDARAFEQRMNEHKAQAKAQKQATPKAETQTRVIAGQRPADAHVGQTVRMSVTKAGTITLKGADKSGLKATQKARLADLAAALKALSAEEREYLQALMS